MKLTVAICTWNREKLLEQTLVAMQKLKIPCHVEWELLIVNNNSTDNTDKVIERHADRMPVRRVFEPKPGLSNARNAAVQQASGDYIIWTDDDVLVDELWIDAYARAFNNWPDAVVFGGPIYPWFEGIPPQWLEAVLSRVSDVYAIRDFGPVTVPLDEDRLPFGANYALKLSIQSQYRYDPALGRKRKEMLGGEEINLICAIFDTGLHGQWVPDAKVFHFIPKVRQNISYIRRYYQGYGASLVKSMDTSDWKLMFGYPQWVVRKAIQNEINYRISRYVNPPRRWIEDLIEASIKRGMLQNYSFRL